MEKKLRVNTQGSAISTRAVRSAFLCGLCASLVNLLFAALEEVGSW